MTDREQAVEAAAKVFSGEDWDLLPAGSKAKRIGFAEAAVNAYEQALGREVARQEPAECIEPLPDRLDALADELGAIARCLEIDTTYELKAQEAAGKWNT